MQTMTGRPWYGQREKLVVDIFFLIAVLMASYYFTWLRFHLHQEWKDATMSALLNGTASKPFQYRVLIPWIVNIVTTFDLPVPPIHVYSTHWLMNSLTAEQARTFVIIEAISVFLLAYAFRYYISLFLGKGSGSTVLSFSIFLILPYNYIIPQYAPFYYPYDIPALLFLTLGLIALYQGKWILYYAVFFIGGFNRETICFLSFVYLFTSFEKDRITVIVAHLSAQFAIWLAIKLFLAHLYIENPGITFGVAFFKNMKDLLYIKQYPLIFSNLGYSWMLLLLFYNQISNRFVRRSVLVIIPYLFGMMMVGLIWELRVFGELIPIVLAGTLAILANLLKNLKTDNIE